VAQAHYAYYHCQRQCRAVNVSKAAGEGAFVDELAILQPRPGYKRADRILLDDRSAKSQNGYCLTFDLSIAIQPDPARPCGVPGILVKLR
jgi:hypothetical protein